MGPHSLTKRQVFNQKTFLSDETFEMEPVHWAEKDQCNNLRRWKVTIHSFRYKFRNFISMTQNMHVAITNFFWITVQKWMLKYKGVSFSCRLPCVKREGNQLLLIILTFTCLIFKSDGRKVKVVIPHYINTPLERRRKSCIQKFKLFCKKMHLMYYIKYNCSCMHEYPLSVFYYWINIFNTLWTCKK